MQNVCPSSGPVFVCVASSEISNSSLSEDTMFILTDSPSSSNLATVSPTPSIATSLDIDSLCFRELPSSSKFGSSSMP